MSLVVKVGGALLQEPAKAVAAIAQIIDCPAVVVHGGGIQITRMLEQMNTTSTFIEGLRVTDERTLRAVSLALLGDVHAQLVQGMHAAGLPAVGIFGGIKALRKDGPWGLVGTQVTADAESLRALLALGRIAVVPTLAMNSDSLLNVNGDETAAAVAVGLGASRLIFMTDVPGVLDEAGKIIGHVSDVDDLLKSRFVCGGMIPKLRAVKVALAGRVRFVQVGQTIFENAS